MKGPNSRRNTETSRISKKEGAEFFSGIHLIIVDYSWQYPRDCEENLFCLVIVLEKYSMSAETPSDLLAQFQND